MEGGYSGAVVSSQHVHCTVEYGCCPFCCLPVSKLSLPSLMDILKDWSAKIRKTKEKRK